MKILYILFFTSNLLLAGGHVVSAYAHIRNYTPYTIALHVLQERILTQWTDKVPQIWYIEPNGMQQLGRVDTLSHVRVTGQFPDNSTVPDSLRTMVDISLPPVQKGKYLLISIFVDNDNWKAEAIYVHDIATYAGGPSGYHVVTTEH
jgi:hypothetical protein